MDTYITRGKLLGGSPLALSSSPFLLSMARASRIADIPVGSIPQGVIDSHYLTPALGENSVLVFPIFWEASQVSSKLLVQLVYDDGTPDLTVTIEVSSPVASDVLNSINSIPSLKAFTHQGYLKIQPKELNVKEIRVLPTSNTNLIASMTHNTRGLFHHVFVDDREKGYIIDPRSRGVRGQMEPTPSRVETPTTSVTSYVQLHEDRTSYGLNRGLDSLARNVEVVNNQNTRPRIEYKVLEISYDVGDFSFGDFPAKWIIAPGGEHVSSIALDSTFNRVELPVLGTSLLNDLYKVTSPGRTSLIRSVKRDDLNLTDPHGGPDEVFGRRVYFESAHLLSAASPRHGVDNTLAQPSFTSGLLQNGGKFEFSKDLDRNPRFSALSWVRIDEVTLAITDEEILFGEDVAFGDLVRLTAENGDKYYFCIDYIPRSNRVVIRSTKDQIDASFDGFHGLQIIPEDLMAGTDSMDIISGPRSTLSDWVILKLENPIRIKDIEDFPSIHIRVPVATDRDNTQAVDSLLDPNSRLLLDFDLTEWLLRLQGPISRELVGHTLTNLHSLGNKPAMGNSLLGLHGGLVPTSLSEGFLKYSTSSEGQSRLDRNVTYTSLNTYGMPVKVFKVLDSDPNYASPKGLFSSGKLRTVQADDPLESYLDIHEFRSPNFITKLDFNPITKVLSDASETSSPFNMGDQGRLVQVASEDNRLTEGVLSKFYTIVEYITPSKVRLRSVSPIDEFFTSQMYSGGEDFDNTFTPSVDVTCTFISPLVAEQISGFSSFQFMDSGSGQEPITQIGQNEASTYIGRDHDINRNYIYPHTYEFGGKKGGGGKRRLREFSLAHDATQTRKQVNLSRTTGVLIVDYHGTESPISLHLECTDLNPTLSSILHSSFFRNSASPVSSIQEGAVFDDSDYPTDNHILYSLGVPNTTWNGITEQNGARTPFEGQPERLQILDYGFFGNNEVYVVFEGSGVWYEQTPEVLNTSSDVAIKASCIYRVTQVTWNELGGLVLALESAVKQTSLIELLLRQIQSGQDSLGSGFVVGNASVFFEEESQGSRQPSGRGGNYTYAYSSSVNLSSKIAPSTLGIYNSKVHGGEALKVLSHRGIGISIESHESGSAISSIREGKPDFLRFLRDLYPTTKYLPLRDYIEWPGVLTPQVKIEDKSSLASNFTAIKRLETLIDSFTITEDRGDLYSSSVEAISGSTVKTMRKPSRMASLFVTKELESTDFINSDFIAKSGGVNINLLREPTAYIHSNRGGQDRSDSAGLLGALSVSIDEFTPLLARIKNVPNLSVIGTSNEGLWTPLDLALHAYGDIKISSGVFSIDTDTLSPETNTYTQESVQHRGRIGTEVLSGIGSYLTPIGDAGIRGMAQHKVGLFGSDKVFGDLDIDGLLAPNLDVLGFGPFDLWDMSVRNSQGYQGYKALEWDTLERTSSAPDYLDFGRTAHANILGEPRTISRWRNSGSDLWELMRMFRHSATQPVNFIGGLLLGYNPSYDVDPTDPNWIPLPEVPWGMRVETSPKQTANTDIGRMAYVNLRINPLLTIAEDKLIDEKNNITLKDVLKDMLEEFPNASLNGRDGSIILATDGDALVIKVTGVITHITEQHIYLECPDLSELMEINIPTKVLGATSFTLWDLVSEIPHRTFPMQSIYQSVITVCGKRWDLNASAVAADCISIVDSGGLNNLTSPHYYFLFDAPVSAISREIIGIIPGDELIRLSSGTGGSFFRSDLRVLEGTLMSYEATDLSNTRLREITRVDDLRGPRVGDWVFPPHNLQKDNGYYYHIFSTETYSGESLIDTFFNYINENKEASISGQIASHSEHLDQIPMIGSLTGSIPNRNTGILSIEDLTFIKGVSTSYLYKPTRVTTASYQQTDAQAQVIPIKRQASLVGTMLKGAAPFYSAGVKSIASQVYIDFSSTDRETNIVLYRPSNHISSHRYRNEQGVHSNQTLVYASDSFNYYKGNSSQALGPSWTLDLDGDETIQAQIYVWLSVGEDWGGEEVYRHRFGNSFYSAHYEFDRVDPNLNYYPGEDNRDITLLKYKYVLHLDLVDVTTAPYALISSHLFQANPTRLQEGKPHFRAFRSFNYGEGQSVQDLGIFMTSPYRGYPFVLNDRTQTNVASPELLADLPKNQELEITAPVPFTPNLLDGGFMPLKEMSGIGNMKHAYLTSHEGIKSYAFFNDFSKDPFVEANSLNLFNEAVDGTNPYWDYKPKFDTPLARAFNLFYGITLDEDDLSYVRTPWIALSGVIGEYSVPMNSWLEDEFDANARNLSEKLEEAFTEMSKVTASKYVVQIPPASALWEGREFTLSIPKYNKQLGANPFLGVWSESRKGMSLTDYFLYYFPELPAERSWREGYDFYQDRDYWALSRHTLSYKILRRRVISNGALFKPSVSERGNAEYTEVHNAWMDLSNNDVLVPNNTFNTMPKALANFAYTLGRHQHEIGGLLVPPTRVSDFIGDSTLYSSPFGHEVRLVRTGDLFYDFKHNLDERDLTGISEDCIVGRVMSEDVHDSDVVVYAKVSSVDTIHERANGPNNPGSDVQILGQHEIQIVDTINVDNVHEGVHSSYTCILIDSESIYPDGDFTQPVYRWVRTK